MEIEEVELGDLQALQTIAELAMHQSVEASEDVKAFLLTIIRSDIEKYLPLSGRCFLKASVAGPSPGGARTIRGYILVKEYHHLSNLFVLPEHHNRGIGGELMANALSECRRHRVDEVMTVNSSLNAVRFYRSFGFVDRVPDKPVPDFAWPMQFNF